MSKSENAYKTIGEVVKILDLKSKKEGQLPTHTLRYWEKEFKQIRPQKIKNRRYYSENQVEIIKLIKFLLKDKGMTINGVKNLLNSDLKKLDDYETNSLKMDYFKKEIQEKSRSILQKIKNLKKYGKKNSH